MLENEHQGETHKHLWTGQIITVHNLNIRYYVVINHPQLYAFTTIISQIQYWTNSNPVWLNLYKAEKQTGLWPWSQDYSSQEDCKRVRNSLCEDMIAALIPLIIRVNISRISSKSPLYLCYILYLQTQQ